MLMVFQGKKSLFKAFENICQGRVLPQLSLHRRFGENIPSTRVQYTSVITLRSKTLYVILKPEFMFEEDEEKEEEEKNPVFICLGLSQRGLR